jgi:hypothetical protein
MREKRKDPVLKHGFLLDRDVSKAASLFPAKRTRTIAQVGLATDASDLEIVRKAWDCRLTIVTANGDDFIREITRFLNQTKRTDCHDMYGLIILPNGYQYQKQLLPGIERKLRLGDERLTWADVAKKDCCVRVKKRGNPKVTRFPRCFYCRKRGHE